LDLAVGALALLRELWFGTREVRRWKVQSSKPKVQTNSKRINRSNWCLDLAVGALILLFELWILNFELLERVAPALYTTPLYQYT
jgi:hypothetical protein